jgi:hypothetical protein
MAPAITEDYTKKIEGWILLFCLFYLSFIFLSTFFILVFFIDRLNLFLEMIKFRILERAFDDPIRKFAEDVEKVDYSNYFLFHLIFRKRKKRSKISSSMTRNPRSLWVKFTKKNGRRNRAN